MINASAKPPNELSSVSELTEDVMGAGQVVSPVTIHSEFVDSGGFAATREVSAADQPGDGNGNQRGWLGNSGVS